MVSRRGGGHCFRGTDGWILRERRAIAGRLLVVHMSPQRLCRMRILVYTALLFSKPVSIFHSASSFPIR